MRRLRSQYVFVPLLAAVIAAISFWSLAGRLTDWPSYQATATLLIENTPDSDQVGMSSQGISIAQSTLAALMVREPLIGQVVSRSGIDMTPSELADRITVSSPSNAPLLEIRVTDADPEQAALLANAVAEEATTLESDLVATSVLSEAGVPSRASLNSYILVAIAGVIGAQLGAAIVALTRRASNLVRSAADLRERSDFPLLGELGLRGVGQYGASSTDRVVVAAFASSLAPGPLALLIVSPIESPHVNRMAMLLGDVLGKLRGFDHIYHDEIRGVGRDSKNDTAIEAVVVTTHKDDVSDPIDLRSWIDQVLVDPEGDDDSSSGDDANILPRPKDPKRAVRIMEGPPLLRNLEIVLGAAEQSQTVLIVQRDVTKMRDFELAVDFLSRSGAPVSGMFLVG